MGHKHAYYRPRWRDVEFAVTSSRRKFFGSVKRRHTSPRYAASALIVLTSERAIHMSYDPTLLIHVLRDTRSLSPTKTV